MNDDDGQHDYARSALPLDYRPAGADRTKLKRWAFCRALFYAAFFAMLTAVIAYLEFDNLIQAARQRDWKGGAISMVLVLVYPIMMFIWSVRSAIQIMQGEMDYPFQQKRR